MTTRKPKATPVVKTPIPAATCPAGIYDINGKVEPTPSHLEAARAEETGMGCAFFCEGFVWRTNPKFDTFRWTLADRDSEYTAIFLSMVAEEQRDEFKAMLIAKDLYAVDWMLRTRQRLAVLMTAHPTKP
jgi:hypothetical protein